MDWESEALLDGLEGDARAARRTLLDELHAEGVPLDELRTATAEGRVVLLQIERALMSPTNRTAEELSELSGVPVEQLLAARGALGLSVPAPEAAAFGDEDLEAARRWRVFLDSGLPVADLLDVERVLADSLSRVAEAIRAMCARALVGPGSDDEHDLGRRYAEMARALMPFVGPELEYVLRLHLREFTRSDAISLAERSAGALSETQEVAVAFADLVGFTRLGEELPAEELGLIAERLTDLARDRVRPPVRIVKTLGDAVMLVSPLPGPMLESVLDLLAAVDAEDDLPPLRAGIAFGPALARLADWYGSTVNLASRVTARARPDSVLVTAGLREALGEGADGYAWSFAGVKHLHNVSLGVPTWRVRRAAAEAD